MPPFMKRTFASIRKEGTFKKFEEHLPELKKMGIGIIWIMPINPIGEKNRKGTLGSYYAVRDYKAINPEIRQRLRIFGIWSTRFMHRE